MNKTMLRAVEAILIASGATLALWCGYSWFRIHQVANIPVPPPPAAQAERLRLPGETPGDEGVVPARASKVPTGTWLAKLEAPSVHLQATVLEGTDDGTLAKAAGHIEGTALPGPTGNIGLAGHRDTVFRAVRHLDLGDEFTLTTAERVYRYRITRTEIVDPEEVWVLGPMPQPTVTLVTCYPFDAIGHAPRRFIVHGELISSDARQPVP
jgi:sortase A